MVNIMIKLFSMQYSQEYIDWKNNINETSNNDKEYLLHLYSLEPTLYLSMKIDKEYPMYINRGLMPLFASSLFNYNNIVAEEVMKKISIEDACYVSWLYKECQGDVFDKIDLAVEMTAEFF